jgi:hypothetical protein
MGSAGFSLQKWLWKNKTSGFLMALYFPTEGEVRSLETSQWK